MSHVTIDANVSFCHGGWYWGAKMPGLGKATLHLEMWDRGPVKKDSYASARAARKNLEATVKRLVLFWPTPTDVRLTVTLDGEPWPEEKT